MSLYSRENKSIFREEKHLVVLQGLSLKVGESCGSTQAWLGRLA